MYRAVLMEKVAETDEELLETFLDDGELSRRAAQEGAAQGDDQQPARARAVRLGIQEQGRAAPARRRGRLPALAAGRPGDPGHGPQVG
jgi:hypothetical protein